MAQENYIEGCSMQGPPLLELNGSGLLLQESYKKFSSCSSIKMESKDNDGIGSKTTKEKLRSLSLKAKVTREQTSDNSDNQGGSDEDIDEEEAEAFNLLARKSIW
ncbi:hypothetical protein Tco_1382051 [Tanacetum coccineum]